MAEVQITAAATPKTVSQKGNYDESCTTKLGFFQLQAIIFCFSATQVRLSIGLLIGLSVFFFIVTMASYCELRHPWPPFGRERRGYDTDIKIVEKEKCDMAES